jgi:hypothetical protein
MKPSSLIHRCQPSPQHDERSEGDEPAMMLNEHEA